MVSAPTSDIGRPDLNYGDWGQGLLSAWYETAADLLWPQSVITYGRMRNDPQLTAVLSAYKLPLLRATWALDPEGCRDEVVQRVSDDMGVGIIGTDMKAGPARRRGVIWHRHLREALGYLTFGHMPFERRYEPQSDGYTRLINLGSRNPWTIAHMKVDEHGILKNITQTTQRQPIPGERLVWYCNELEGANWAGTSMLRPAFGAWLLKHETWRVHATSIRRFGMGVPSVTAPQGATQTQVAQAQQLASSMRSGDSAGMGLPQGFQAQLMGITGSVPDALAFIKYLDIAMAKMVLAGLIELGQTDNGSRALGETFMDLFQLSLQAVADEVATTATSGYEGLPGIITDLVDQNWGEDEPAPRLVCTDVGENYDITATSINSLVSSGAMTPDPSLDEWIRKTWRLPERDDKWTPSSRGLPAGGGQGGDVRTRIAQIEQGKTQPALPAAETPKKPDEQPDQLKASAPPTRAQLAYIEASTWEPKQHQDDWEKALAALLLRYRTIMSAQRTDLVDRVVTAMQAGDQAALALAAPDTGNGPDLVAEAMTLVARTAAQSVVDEAFRQGVQIDLDRVRIDANVMGGVARARTSMAAAFLAQQASSKALQTYAPGPADFMASADEVDRFLGGLSSQSLRDQLGAALTVAQNQGRFAVMEAAPESEGTATYVAAEVLDSNTCDHCRRVDGREFDSIADAVASYPTGGYSQCEGLMRCRGTVVAVWGRGGANPKAGGFNPRQLRRKDGQWSIPGLGALSRNYNDIPETRGPGRSKGQFNGPSGRDLADRAKQGGEHRHIADPITDKEARDSSRAVKDAEYQDLAKQGVNQLGRLRAMRSPTKGLDDNWPAVKTNAWKQVQDSWGGVTVDAHTGKPLDTNADKYALSVKSKGMTSVSVPEGASEAEFGAAMDQALTKYRGLLEAQQSHLGVFHDDENHRIDIDPVLVVDTKGEVEAIGAYTHAIGGAYHFKSGDGYYPPHVVAASADGKTIHWAGPGQWRSNAAKVQPGLTVEQDREISDTGTTSAKFNPLQRRDRNGRWTLGPAGKLVQELLTRWNTPDGETRDRMTTKLAKTTTKRSGLPDYDTTVGMLEREIAQAADDAAALRNGQDWYPGERKMNEERAKKYNVTVEIAAAVESALSPHVGYAQNQRLTDDLLTRVPDLLRETTAKKLIQERRIGGGLPDNISMAIELLDGSPIETTLTGDKRKAFYSNIVSPNKTGQVTIDTWMQQSLQSLGLNHQQAVALAGERGKGFEGGLGNMLVAEATRRAAGERGLSPDAMQAVYWIWAKARAGDTNPTGRSKGGRHASAAANPETWSEDQWDAEVLLEYLGWRKANIPGRIDLGPPGSAREDDSLAAENQAAWRTAQADPRWAKLGLTLAEAKKIASKKG